MTARQPFAPAFTRTVTVAATTTSAPFNITAGNKQWSVANAGTTVAFIRAFKSGNGTPAATAADFPILPGSDRVITVDQDFDRASVVAASGTPTLYITPGEGFE